MLYRVLKPLETGHQPGALVFGRQFKHAAALARRGALAEVRLPPVAALTWLREDYRARLAEAGITDSITLLEADPVKLAAQIHTRADRVQSWQAELRCMASVMDAADLKSPCKCKER